MEAYGRLVLMLLVMALSGCSSMLSTMASGIPVPNYVYLHERPVAGDFAQYQSFDGAQIMRMEITDVLSGNGHSSLYRVKVSWPVAGGMASGFLRDHAYLFEVEPGGSVLRAGLMHVPTGAVRPLPVAGPGELGYISVPKLVPLGSQEALSVSGVNYPVDRVLVYEEHRQGPAGPMHITSTNFINSQLPFGLVKQINVLQTQVTMVEVVKMINQFSPAGTAVKWLVNFLVNLSKNQRAENGMTLIETSRPM